MWPTVILGGISIATGPDETTMMVVYKRPRKATPKWCQEEESRCNSTFVIDSHIQVWYTDVRSLRAKIVVTSANIGIS